MVYENLSQPMQGASLEELNRVFSRFNAAYENMMEHYSSGGHSDFMRAFLGNGIVPSLRTIDALKQGKGEGSARVGHALSVFHYAIRNTGKIWGSYLDMEAIDPEFRAILAYIKSPESVPLPPVLMPMGDQQMVDEILSRFSPEKMPKIPLKTKDRKIEINNATIHIVRNVSEGDFGTYEYDIPAAALVWSIRQAGMEVLSRPKESTIRKIIERCVGVGEDAGKSMVNLHHLAPEVFCDYDKETIEQVISDQRYWIRAARACSVILGGKGSEFSDVLQLIGKDPEHITFGSASKIAVIIYAITERLETEKALQQIDDLKEIAPCIKEAMAQLYEISAPTEKEIQAAKGEARREHNKLLNEGGDPTKAAEDATKKYQQDKNQILARQRQIVTPILNEQKTVDALCRLFTLVRGVGEPVLSEAAQHYVNHAEEYVGERFSELNFNRLQLNLVTARGRAIKAIQMPPLDIK